MSPPHDSPKTYWVMYRKISRMSSSVIVARTRMWRTIVAIIRGGNLCGDW